MGDGCPRVSTLNSVQEFIAIKFRFTSFTKVSPSSLRDTPKSPFPRLGDRPDNPSPRGVLFPTPPTVRRCQGKLEIRTLVSNFDFRLFVFFWCRMSSVRSDRVIYEKNKGIVVRLFTERF